MRADTRYGHDASIIGAGKSLHWLLNEPRLIWRFIESDIWAAVVPGLLVTLIASSHAGLSGTDLLVVSFKSLIYFWLYLYGHTLANQLTGVEEDTQNKPTRPLPSGLVSMQGTAWRLVIVTLLYALYGWWLGVIWWTLLWIATHLFLNFYGHRHWFSKNIIAMTLGTQAMIGAGWEIVEPLTSQQWRWALIVSGVAGCGFLIQDFRDVEGDRLSGRRTLPHAIGQNRSRIAVCIVFFVSMLIVYTQIIVSAPASIGLTLLAAAIGLLPLIIAIRLLIYRTVEADHRSYMMYLSLFLLWLSSGIVLF